MPQATALPPPPSSVEASWVGRRRLHRIGNGRHGIMRRDCTCDVMMIRQGLHTSCIWLTQVGNGSLACLFSRWSHDATVWLISSL